MTAYYNECDPATGRINRQRERRTRSEDRNVLRAAVYARGAEEAGFMDDDSREGRKGRQRAKNEGAGE